MELRFLIHLIKKNFILIIFICLATTLGAVSYTIRKPLSYDVAVALVTNYESKAPLGANQNYYRFDGFYAFQAAERFSQVIVGVLKSANAAKEIYQLAGVPLDAVSISELSKRFKPDKRTERVVEVTYSANTKEEAKKLGEAMQHFMNTQAQIASKSSEEGSFSVATSDPVILRARSRLLIWGSVGFLGGLLLSIMVAGLIYYFKEDA